MHVSLQLAMFFPKYSTVHAVVAQTHAVQVKTEIPHGPSPYTRVLQKEEDRSCIIFPI